VTKLEPGSTLYYSLLWTDEPAKNRFLQRLELIQAINTTLDEVQEPQVAEKKIHWWHEELQRMVDGKARHPSTKAVQDSYLSNAEAATVENENSLLSTCLNLLSSVSSLRFTPPSSFSDRETQLIDNFSARLALMSHALSENPEDLIAASHPASAALALAKHEQLSRLPALLHRGQAVFSDDMYQTHKVQPSDLAAKVRVAASDQNEQKTATKSELVGIPVVEHKPGVDSLLRSAIEDTHASFLKATINPTVSSQYRKDSLLPIWRLIVLRRKQMALWAKRNPDLLKENMQLTPISKFICAWKNRREVANKQ